jgi:dihydroneopterin aldolase
LTNTSKLTIPGLRLWVSLGCSAEERAVLQPIDVDIQIQFLDELPGFHSDQLSEVICYHTLVDRVTDLMKNKSFNLVERVTLYIFEFVAKHLGNLDVILEVTVTKPHHPIPSVQKGITFTYGRRVSQKSL